MDAWQQLRDAFHRLHDGQPGGAALSVMQQGRLVVEEISGTATPPDEEHPQGGPWTPRTLVGLASATKAMASSALLLQVERGLLDLDNPIADWWPAFAANGKGRATVRDLLGHRVGVVTVDHPIPPGEQYDRTPILDMLAARVPDWEPGSRHGYHAVTFGWLVDGLVTAVCGRSVFDVFTHDIAEPYGLDLTMQLDAERLQRVATPITPDDMGAAVDDPAYRDFNAAMQDPGSLLYRATYGACAVDFSALDDPYTLFAPDPSGGGHGTATALAGLYAALTTGTDRGSALLSPDLVRQVAAPVSDGLDAVLRLHSIWGLGFMLPGGPMWPTAAPGTFGHGGASGSLAYADPERGLTFAYTPSAWLALTNGIDERAKTLVGLIPTT